VATRGRHFIRRPKPSLKHLFSCCSSNQSKAICAFFPLSFIFIFFSFFKVRPIKWFVKYLDQLFNFHLNISLFQYDFQTLFLHHKSGHFMSECLRECDYVKDWPEHLLLAFCIVYEWTSTFTHVWLPAGGGAVGVYLSFKSNY